MAIPMTASQYLAALRAEGVRVSEMNGWRTHNRNRKGAWGPVNGVLIHHTAGVSTGMAAFVRNGSSELPGPLSHAMAAKNGTVYIPGYGRANHAGRVAENAFASVVAEDGKHPRPSASEPRDGNRHLYGIEIENRGDGKDPYPSTQYDQAVRWAAALCRFHKWSAESVAGHKEMTRRKIDPSFSMDAFRAKVAERLEHPASWTPGASTPTKPAPPKPAPTPSTGEAMRLTMLSRTVPLTIPAGEDRMVYFPTDLRDDPNEHGDGGYTVLSTASVYTGTAWAWLPGTLDPVKLSIMAVQEIPENPVRNSIAAFADVFTQDEDHIAAVSVTGKSADGEKTKITIRNYGDEPVTVARVDLRIMSVSE